MATVAAVQARKAAGNDASRVKGIEPLFDEMLQVNAYSVVVLRDEAGGVLLRQAAMRGLFRAVTLVENRGMDLTNCQEAARQHRLLMAGG